MLHEFLVAQRELIIDRCRFGTAHPSRRNLASDESYEAIAEFLTQLTTILSREQGGPGAAPAGAAVGSEQTAASAAEIAASAAQHGQNLYRLGYTIEQVVRNYGDLCQAITSLALEMRVPIATAEFRTLNRCLDDGIASAVVAFSSRSRLQAVDPAVTQARHDARLDGLAAMHAHLQSAAMAVAAIRTGRVGMEGATSQVLTRSLAGLQKLVDEGLAQAE